MLVMELASKLREILDGEIVADDPGTVAAHSGDKWFATHPPDVVVLAKSTADVSKSKIKRERKRKRLSHAHYLIPAIDIDDLAGNGCGPVAGEKNSRSA